MRKKMRLLLPLTQNRLNNYTHPDRDAKNQQQHTNTEQVNERERAKNDSKLIRCGIYYYLKQ